MRRRFVPVCLWERVCCFISPTAAAAAATNKLCVCVYALVCIYIYKGIEKLLSTSCHHSPLCSALDQKGFSRERSAGVSQLSWMYIFHQPCSINREMEKGSSCVCQMFHWSSHASSCTHAKTLSVVLPELTGKFFWETLAFNCTYSFFCPVGRGDGCNSWKKLVKKWCNSSSVLWGLCLVPCVGFFAELSKQAYVVPACLSCCDEGVFAHEALFSGSIECYVSLFVVQAF